MGGWDLELFLLLAKCLLGLVVWYRGALWLLLVAVPTLNSSSWILSQLPPLPHPPLHPTHPLPHYTDLKLVPT